ncbi:zinc finger protein 385A-like [Senna tora]|uniref:Zinc finger protein 385A-like n=1 Tax=Senna tora TaxID=362788 RepID=A0A834XHX4_9FABA|nr:zinc finger protein 385A-like [Senna tora]
MDYSAYQQHHQQSYDPSQNLAYDQSSQSYYAYNQQYDHQYGYYHHQDQANPYALHQFQQESASIHPPGVPILPDQSQMQNQQNVVYLTGVAENQQQPGLDSGAVNPAAAAVAALSQLGQFGGSVDVAQGAAHPPIQIREKLKLKLSRHGCPNKISYEQQTPLSSLSTLTVYSGDSPLPVYSGELVRANGTSIELFIHTLTSNRDIMHKAPPEFLCLLYQIIGSSQYRGGGGKGSRPFRRGGRGHFNYRGRAPYRGRGRGRNFSSHSSGPANSYVEIAPAVSGATPEAPPTVTKVPTAPLQPSSNKEWCEICKVECNSLDILEQHKNGKRHKKNLQVHEELQRHKAIDEQQSGQMATSELNVTVQPEKPSESKTEGCIAEKLGSEAADANPKDASELQNNTGETSEVPADEPKGNPRDGFAPRGRGCKRKIRGSRGGKFMRTNDGLRRPVEPPKPKQPTTFICELCNVRCESQVVYDSHLIGKRHQSTLKRVHGPQASFSQRAVGLQVLHPQDSSALPNSIDINALTNSINAQVQQGVNDPQVLLAQLLMNVLSQTQGSAVAQPSGSVAAQVPAPTPVAGSSYETQLQNVSQTQVSESAGHGGNGNPTGETQDQLKDPGSGSSETGEMVQNLPQNGSVATPAENQSAANEQGPSECKAPPS